MSCGTEKYVQFMYADLRAFGEQKPASELQFEAFEAGGGGLKREQSIVWHDVTCSWTTSGNEACLEVNVPDFSGYLEGSVKALNLPENWKGSDEISLQAENPNQHPVILTLTVFGPRNVLTDTFRLRANQEQTLIVSLPDLPLATGNQRLYIPNKIRISAVAAEPAFNFILTGLRLRPGPPPYEIACVDAFGQRIRGSWDKKIANESGLITSKTEEEKYLSEIPDNEQGGRYFGLESEQKFNATGFFRLEKVLDDKGEKWWFITPDGQPFWSLGVTCIRPRHNRTAVTNIKNREFLFEQLPSRN